MNGLITESQLMEKLQLSQSTLYRFRKKGMPYKQIGRSIRYDELEVKKWLEENQEK